MVKAIRVHAYGGPEEMRLDEVPLAKPGQGEVVIRQRAIGLNFADIHNRTGRYPLPSLPHAIGGEAVGVIEAVGPGVSHWQAGDRAGYAAGGPDFQPGAYAEARVFPADRLIPLPDAIDDVTAAAILTKGITAQYLLKNSYAVKSGDTIVLHAAAGGVGTLLAQWARHLGCRVIGIVGSREKAAVARANGSDEVIVSTEEDIVARVRALTADAGVPVVYDSVGRDTFEASLRCLAPHGTLVAFGTSSGRVPPFEIFQLNRLGSLYVTSPGFAWFVHTREELLARAADLFSVVLSGAVRIQPPRQYALADAATAHRDLEARRTSGASVLIP
jgi:NADPH2:quinone reductase